MPPAGLGWRATAAARLEPEACSDIEAPISPWWPRAFLTPLQVCPVHRLRDLSAQSVTTGHSTRVRPTSDRGWTAQQPTIGASRSRVPVTRATYSVRQRHRANDGSFHRARRPGGGYGRPMLWEQNVGHVTVGQFFYVWALDRSQRLPGRATDAPTAACVHHSAAPRATPAGRPWIAGAERTDERTCQSRQRWQRMDLGNCDNSQGRNFRCSEPEDRRATGDVHGLGA